MSLLKEKPTSRKGAYPIIAIGLDSTVSRWDSQSVIKIYDQSKLSAEQVGRYTAKTNEANDSLDLVSAELGVLTSRPMRIGNYHYPYRIKINPVSEMGLTREQIAYSISPFIPGLKLDDLTAADLVKPGLKEAVTVDLSPLEQIIYQRMFNDAANWNTREPLEPFGQMNSGLEWSPISQVLSRSLKGARFTIIPTNVKLRADAAGLCLVITDLCGEIRQL